MDTNSSNWWVAPFGDLRVLVYLQLTVAFRCSSRPSSAPSAKASTVHSFFLNLTNIYTFDKYYSIFKDLLFNRKTKSFKTKQKITVRQLITRIRYKTFLPRKEVIHPHVLVGIPCYDFTPIICPTLDGSLLAVKPPASGITNSHGVTGGVYKTRERIHRDMLIHDY